MNMTTTSSTDGLRKLFSYILLPVASGLGFYGTLKLARDNGLTVSILQGILEKPSYLPGLRGTPIRQWTDITPIDNYFSFFVSFFWPVITSEDPKVQLSSRHFIGQFVGLWTLLEMEGVRAGEGLLSRTLLTGLSIQNFGAATTIPLYAAIQLARSRSSTKVNEAPPSAEQSQRLRAIPIAITLGLLVPLGVMSFSKSTTVKQLAIIIFQIYPVFTSAILRLVAPYLPKEAAIKRKAGDALPGPLSTVYIFATVIGAIVHLATISESLSKGVTLKEIFLPRITLGKAGDMDEARVNFLQWDEAVTCGSLLLWALARYVIDTSPARGINTTTVVQALMGAAVRTVLMGPVGAAAELLRQREIARA